MKGNPQTRNEEVMSSDPTNPFGSNQYNPTSNGYSGANANYPPLRQPSYPPTSAVAAAPPTTQQPAADPAAQPKEPPAPKQPTEASSKLAAELKKFHTVTEGIRENFSPLPEFEARCQQAFDIANDLFSNAPTWVCFYRELMGERGLIHTLFPRLTDQEKKDNEFGAFLRTDQHYQIQMMLTALRSREMPENDPNDPQRMITVRLPKSLHEAMCEEAGQLKISVNRLCISRMLQLLDPKMIPETTSKPRGRKPRGRQKQES